MIHLPPNMTKVQCAAFLGCTVEQMDATHDACHRALEQITGVESYALREAANDDLTPHEKQIAIYDEEAALCLQRLLCALGRLEAFLEPAQP